MHFLKMSSSSSSSSSISPLFQILLILHRLHFCGQKKRLENLLSSLKGSLERGSLFPHKKKEKKKKKSALSLCVKFCTVKRARYRFARVETREKSTSEEKKSDETFVTSLSVFARRHSSRVVFATLSFACFFFDDRSLLDEVFGPKILVATRGDVGLSRREDDGAPRGVTKSPLASHVRRAEKVVTSDARGSASKWFYRGEKEDLYRIREGSRSKRRRRNRKTAPGPRRKMTKSKKMTKKKSKKQQKRGGRISLR